MGSNSELAVVEGLWATLDDKSLIKDVAMKGKFVSNAIKFIATRNSKSVEESKDFFFLEANEFVINLIRSKQVHRAIHVLKNVQLNEFYYLYDFYQEETDETVKSLIYDRLHHLEPEFEKNADILYANHQLFKLLSQNISVHGKCLDALNRRFDVSAVTPSNIHKIIFGTFMKQPQSWRDEIATDVFFKSQNFHLRHVLEKHSFFAYILRNELYTVIKHWLQEAYICRAGKMIQSTINKPESFDSALISLYREWSFEPKMMDLIARREKDVIKNDFAKLGLFESREDKYICRKLNRFFTTHSFHDNFPHLKTDQVTKFVIENSLMDLLPDNFIDFRYIKLLLDNLDVIYMRGELELVEKMRNLLKPETELDEFLSIVRACSDYLDDDNKSAELKLVTESLGGLAAKDFGRICDVNSFTQNLDTKIKSKDKLPEVEEILENFYSISLDIIREEFNEVSVQSISFDDQKIASSYAEVVTMKSSNAVGQLQSAYGTLLLLKEIIKNFITVSKSQVIIACEEIAKLAVEDPNDRDLVTHVMTFLEILSVDSRNLRAYMMLLKLKAFEENQGFELNDSMKEILTETDLKKAEAYEIVWNVKRVRDPPRNYLNNFLKAEYWFQFVLVAQYLNFSLRSFVAICDGRFQNRAMADNLIRAVFFESSPEFKKRCSFSKKRRQRSANNEENELFAKGKFLETKSDLFAILLKCDESLDRREKSFEDFQRLALQRETSNDLLQQAMEHDWPLIAVVAGTTKLYRWKFCWITHLVLSSDFKWTEKFKSIAELSMSVVKHCVQNGFNRTIDESIAIFYPDSALKLFSTFLHISHEGDVDQMESTLKQFIVKLVDRKYDLVVVKGKKESMGFTVDCIVKHLQANFKTTALQQKCLEALCRSQISEFSESVDFDFMIQVCKILERTNVKINFENFMEKDIQNFSQICENLMDEHQFETVIELCDVIKQPKDDFIFNWFVHIWSHEDRHNKEFEAKQYLKYLEKYDISIEVMLKFLKKVVEDLEPCAKKFNVMKFIMRNSWVKNSAELDALEYEITLLYIRLKAKDPNIDLSPLNSEHYDSLVSKGKHIIHNSLFELKAIAKSDELTVSQKNLEDSKEQELLDELILSLLDAGDVVQVLRIQEMFGRAPEDLKLLVYIMSIAEGINSIYDISKEERKLISSYGLMSNKFNRMTLRSLRTNSSNSMSSSPSNDLTESVILDESFTRNSFKENKETFLALQGLACKMKYGTKQAQRIALIYRASLFLNRNFVDLMKMQDSFEILELAASTDCEDKLMVMHDIMIATQMSSNEIAEFVAKEVAACIIRTRFLQFTKDTEIMVGSTTSWNAKRADDLDDIWGFSLTKNFHLILELCVSSTSLGNCLLKYYELLSKEPADIPFRSEDCELDRICEQLNRMLSPQMMSLKKQNIIRVELLIMAHEAYCNECNNEGIANILNLAKALCAQLAAKKSFSLIIRMLCGIGRYREMFYCFEILIKNEQFETLLGKFSDNHTNSLKQAILNYLNEYHPQNKEYFKMAASHFLMYTELANIWRSESLDQINCMVSIHQTRIVKTGRTTSNQEQQVEIAYLKSSNSLVTGLNTALTGMIHATEMVLMDNKIDQSIRFSSFCELIAVQIHLAKLGCEKEDKLCPNILNQEHNVEKLQYIANYELNVPQTMILIKNTDLKIDFVKAISVRLLLEDESYLLEYMSRVELSDETIEAVVKMSKLDNISLKQEKMLNDLVMMVSDKGLRFRLASLLGLKAQLQSMLNDQGTYYYLLDSLSIQK